jgi:hypothetical protein
MANYHFDKIVCGKCGQVDANVNAYDQYNRGEEAHKNGYKCDSCKLSERKRHQDR